ncbi:MAG: hypothetical protein IJV05_02165 [Muribaculaceae bacterium]|nr:hypothetical protein [Muribaculaceae bacterium]
MALCEARQVGALGPQATLTYGQCALGLRIVKAAGLVEVFDLIIRH